MLYFLLYLFFHIQKSSLNLKITDKTYNTELEKIIPKLWEFKFKSLEFDLGYTSKSVFQSIMEYLDGCGKDSLESFKTKVFSRHEFESLIEFFVNTNINLKSVKLILFTEVIGKLFFQFNLIKIKIVTQVHYLNSNQKIL